jgi:hypothetical protein
LPKEEDFDLTGWLEWFGAMRDLFGAKTDDKKEEK